MRSTLFFALFGPKTHANSGRRFAVVVVPNYVDPADAATCPFRSSNAAGMLAEGENKNSWRWFNTVNRVCSGVKKVRFFRVPSKPPADSTTLRRQTLVLLQVLIPPMSSLPSPNFIAENPAQAMAMLQMREVTVRRWMAGRMRD